MSKIQAFSSVVVTDYADVGHLNLYLTSNQPTTVIYDPNQNQYTPNWEISKLLLTPVISFNGETIPLTSVSLSVSFKRQVYGRFKGDNYDNIEYLTEEQMQMVLNIHPVHGSQMEAARDLFVFQMFTGLSYADSGVRYWAV